MRKKTIGLLFGGDGSEHKISVRSAKNLSRLLNKEKYNLLYIGIDHKKRWFLCSDLDDYCETVDTIKDKKEVCIRFGSRELQVVPTGEAVTFDLFIPMIHGKQGEDGQLQGILEMIDVPYIGCGILSSAICIDKDMTKRILKEAGVPVVDSITVKDGAVFPFRGAVERLGLPLFIKPSNEGSSVGITKVFDEKDYWKGLKQAFSFDRKVLIEKRIEGREIECAVWEEGVVNASVLGEIMNTGGFYDFEKKYLKSDAKPTVPARIETKKGDRIRKMAKEVFETLACEGFARVDFFLTKSGDLYVNEVNTIPGFTDRSLFPEMIKKSGHDLGAMFDKMIEEKMSKKKQ